MSKLYVTGFGGVLYYSAAARDRELVVEADWFAWTMEGWGR